MNERRKILDLVQEGKLTAEQGEQLLAALDEQAQRRRNQSLDIKSLSDLKHLGSQWGNQISQLVGQSLAEARRNLEKEMRHFNWNFHFGPGFGFGSTLTVSANVQLPESIRDLYVETKNGEIQVSTWNQSFVRILVRGQVKASDLNAAQRVLDRALQAQQTDDSYLLTVVHDFKDGVVGANIEVSVPTGLRRISLKSTNGGLYIDTTEVEDLQLVTANGGVRVNHCRVTRLRIDSDNGSLDIHDSVHAQTKSVYAQTKNGTIVIDGVSADATCSGMAKAGLGRVDVSGDRAQVEYVELGDHARHSEARFQVGEESVDEETRIYCESRNGSVRIRA
jgi:polyhydroxyalkanoate synthesis regulator phasin